MRSIASPPNRRARDLASRPLLLGAALALATPALAQSQPAAPTREELTSVREDPGRDRASRLSVEGDIERGPCPLADPAYASTRVTFSAVEFSGLTGVPTSVLDSAWRDLAGRELPIAAVCDLRDRAATILRDMGYLAAVQIPPQRIEANGTVRMDVLAAKLVEVQLRGDGGHSERLIAAHLERLTRQPWFNTREAERTLLLLEDLPGFDVRLMLRSAGRQPGEVIGDVVITRRPFEVVAGAQNLGSRSAGREAAFVALTANDLTGLGDRTSVSVFNTIDWHELRIVTLAHDMAIGAGGLRLGGSVLFGHSEPDIGVAFESDTFSAKAQFSYPFVRRQSHSLFGSAGIEMIDQELKLGNALLSRDKLRVVFARVDHEMVDPDSLSGRNGFTAREPRWRNTLSLEVRQGLSGLGASEDCRPLAQCQPPNVPISDLFADPSSFVARLEGNFELRPAPQVTIAFSPRAQTSDGALLSYEQAGLGNYSIGRGFDPGIAAGDRALGAAFELRYGSVYPHEEDALAFEPFVFLDYAKAWLDEDSATPEPRSVLSAGGGVRGRWGDRADFGLTLALPLQRAGYQTDKGDVRLLFTVTTRLLSWGDR